MEWHIPTLVVRNNEDDDFAQISGENVVFSEMYVSVHIYTFFTFDS